MIFRLAEISLFVIIDLFFNILLAVVPFRRFMRFSKSKNKMLFITLFMISVTVRVIGLQGAQAAAICSVFLAVVYLVCYVICFSVSLTKLLFVLLVLMNSASFVSIVNNYLTDYLSPVSKGHVYSFWDTCIYFFALLCVYPVIAYLMKYKIEPLVSSGIDNIAWRFLWIVPATFCFSYYYNLYSNGGYILYTKQLNNVLFIILYNFSGLVVTFLIAGLVKDSNDFLLVKAENYMVSLQQIQYDYMKNHMEEIRRAKHDMRQLMAVIHSSISSNDINRLKEYMDKHMNSAFPPDIVIHYCENFALNALLVYYGALADKKGILIRTNIQYPEVSSLDESDMIVLFGNLLENAYEACMRQTKSQPAISLAIQMTQNALVITLDNPYDGHIKQMGTHFVSSKTNGIGIGISSISRIVDKYHGTLKFEYDQSIFKASLILKLN